MRAIRRGPQNRGPFSGSDVLIQVPLGGDLPFPTVVWVTLAVQKRRNLRKWFKTKSQLFKPTKTTAVVIVVFPRDIKVIQQRAIKQEARRRRVKTQFTDVFGRPTTQTVPESAKILGQAVLRSKRRIKTKTVLGKPTVTTVVVVVTRLPLVIKVVEQTGSQKRKFKVRIRLGDVFGTPTTRVSPEAARFVGFEARAAGVRRRRAPVKMILGDVVRFFQPTPPVITDHHYVVAPNYVGQMMIRG